MFLVKCNGEVIERMQKEMDWMFWNIAMSNIKRKLERDRAGPSACAGNGGRHFYKMSTLIQSLFNKFYSEGD